MKRAIYGDTFSQTEALCCETCGRPKPVAIKGIEFEVKGVRFEGRELPFTVLETELFRMLAKSFGHVCHKSRLHNALYASDENGGPGMKIMDVLVCYIRKKLKAAQVPLEIKTVWGVGFQLLALRVEN
jgi:DNA-binding response OmpR family regulator